MILGPRIFPFANLPDCARLALIRDIVARKIYACGQKGTRGEARAGRFLPSTTSERLQRPAASQEKAIAHRQGFPEAGWP